MKTRAWSRAISFVMFCISATTLASAALDWQRLANPHGNTRFSSTADRGLQARDHNMGDWALAQKSITALPKPGVYKTEPYACIVVVPGKCPDDRSVVAPAERDSETLVIKPELSFSPLRSK